MSRPAAVVALVLLCVMPLSVLAHPLQTVPPGHWAYAALRQLAAMGLVPFRTLASLPLTRGEIAELVGAAELAARARNVPVGARDLLAALRREFPPDTLQVRPQVMARAAPSPGSRTVYPGVAPGWLLGGGTGVGGPGVLVWAEGGVTSAGAQVARAYGLARIGRVYLQLGRDVQQWSVSPRTSFLLSEWAGGLGMARLVVDSGRFRFTKFATPLRPGSRTVYLVGTRLDWQANDRLRIGFSESVVTFAGRMLAYALLDPFPVLLTQALDPVRLQLRYIREEANFLGAVDFDWLIRPGLQLSGQLLVDDFSSVGDRPHRLGGLLAVTSADPFHNGRTSVRLEYSAVLNFTYTEMANSRFSYVLPDGRFLGYWLGNDADDLMLELRHVLNQDATLSGWLARTRHGPGRIGQPFPPGNKSFRRSFLSGIVETRWAIGAQYETRNADRTMRYWGEIASIQNQNNRRGRNGTDVLFGLEVRW